MQVEAVHATETLNMTDLSDLQVLVVDDELTICDTLKLFLKHLGINHVRAVHNGEEALKEIESTPFDYVFMDLMMPKINGMEVLKKINEYDQPTSVIIMTGYPSMEVVIDAMHHGASDFLVQLFGEKGKHSRVSVGMSSLPLDSPVEIDFIIEGGNTLES